jgi:hypothetical protein
MPRVRVRVELSHLQIRSAGFRKTGQCSAGGRTGRHLQSIKTVRRLTVGDSARSESILALSVDKMTVVDGSLGQPTTRNVALTENRSGRCRGAICFSKRSTRFSTSGNKIRVHAANEALAPRLTVAELVLVPARVFWRGAL